MEYHKSLEIVFISLVSNQYWIVKVGESEKGKVRELYKNIWKKYKGKNIDRENKDKNEKEKKKTRECWEPEK